MEEIVKYEDRDGALVTLTPQDVAQYCASGNAQLSERDVVSFMATCKALGANPFVGDVYLVKYGSGDSAQIIAGKNYYTRVAVSIPTYNGATAGTIVVTKDGEVAYRTGSMKWPGDTCIGGWAEVHDGRWDVPVRSEVALDEYDSKRSLWKTKPLTMIRKVALVQALREAYPDRFAGTYDSSEMGEQGEAEPPSKARRKATPTEAEKSRMAEVVELAVAASVDREEARGYVWELYKREGMSPVEEWAAQLSADQPVEVEPEDIDF